MIIPDLLCYVDDVFSWDFDGHVCWYEPYHRFLPSRQYALLRLWDALGIPHEDRKQVFGSPLTIIGFEVDPNALTITMPYSARSDLIKAIREFARPGCRRPLREFQSLAGWINWSLNVFPHLKPGLSSLYAKIKGKTRPHQPVWVSVKVSRELLWLAGHIARSTGIFMLDSVDWDPSTADLTLYSDACPSSIAFWNPSCNQGFFCLTNSFPTDTFPSHAHADIFFLEALAVISALDHACRYAAITSTRRPRILIYTDSLNTVDIFDSLHALPVYNSLLMTAVDLSLRANINFRVLHIPGSLNRVADTHSRSHFDRAKLFSPCLDISIFTPPRLTLGAAAS